MQVSRLTLPILSLHFLIDKNERYLVEDVYDQIDNGDIFQKISEKYGDKYQDIRMDGLTINSTLFPDDHAEIIERLQGLANASTAATFGVDSSENGLIFLAGLLNELIQQSDVDLKLDN